MLEAEVLELHLEPIDAEPVGDWCVDVQRLARDALFLVERHRTERLHVVQPVRKFHQDNADVLDHREHHLAEALGLGLGAAAKLDLVELADAIHDQCNLGAKLLFDLFEGGVRVFDGVVQNGGDNGLGVEMHLGQFLRDRDRVGYIRLARFSRLTFMGGRTELVCLGDRCQLFFRQVGLQRFDQARHAVVPPVGAGQLRQNDGSIVHAPIIPAERRMCMCSLGAASGRPRRYDG